MTGFKSKKTAALDEEGMYLVHQTASAPFSLSAPSRETPSLTFIGGNSEWVMRITADRRIEVNEGVQVTEAAQKVLDALQHLLPPQPAQEFGLTQERFNALEVEITTLQSYWQSALKEVVRLNAAQPALDKLEQAAFDAWWDTQPRLNETNPCSVDSFEYWAWEGWHAALAQPAQAIHTCTPPPQENT